MFSLIDAERQWFKSRVGIDTRETPREEAFCAHAILQRDPLVVPDAAADPRFADNALVTGHPDNRFHAGVPTRSRAGLALGTLCAIDSTPRELSDADLQALQDLADIITKEIQYRETLLTARETVERSGEAIALSEAQSRAVFDLACVSLDHTGVVRARHRQRAGCAC